MIVRRTLKWRQVVAYVGRPIALHVLVASGVALAHDHAGASWLAVPALPVTILASTIGILLAFRNNSGYDRWWEARTLWGGLVNQSRTFARQLLTYLPSTLLEDDGDGAGDEAFDRVSGGAERRHAPAEIVQSRLAASAVAPAASGLWLDGGSTRTSTDGAVRDREGRAGAAHARADGATATDVIDGPMSLAERCAFDAVSAEARELVYAQIGFVNAVRCHLRRQDPFPEIAPFFRPGLVDALRDEQNVPAAILVWMATRLRRLFAGRRPEDAYRLVALDETLTELTNLLGGCERIKNTPIPRQYDWLPRVVARAYLFLLPLSVVDALGFATPLVTAVIAFLFLSMDTIGRNVEAPFENGIHDTPMTALCRTIEINLRQMLGETELPPPVQPVDGFLY